MDYAHLVVCGVLFFLYVPGFSLKIFGWVLSYLRAWGILVCNFLTLSLSGFGIRIMLESQNVLKSILFASVFWKRLCRIYVVSIPSLISLLVISLGKPVKSSWPRGFFFGGLNNKTEKAMAPHSSTLAWRIPWMEEPGGMQSMGSLRVGHDWETSLSLFTFMHWRKKWQHFQCSCLENPRDGGAWWAAVYGIAQSRTLLKWLSSRSIEITICL